MRWVSYTLLYDECRPLSYSIKLGLVGEGVGELGVVIQPFSLQSRLEAVNILCSDCGLLEVVPVFRD